MAAAKERCMNIGTICRHRIVTVDSQAPLTEAATLMREHHVGALIVTREGDDGVRVCGVVTDRDLVLDALANGLDGARVTVGELASPQPVSVSEDDDLDTALALMRDSGVRRLLVVDGDRQLTGIVSLDDLVECCVELVAGLGEVIRSGIAREQANGLPLPVPPMLRIPAIGTAAWGNVPAAHPAPY